VDRGEVRACSSRCGVQEHRIHLEGRLCPAPESYHILHTNTKQYHTRALIGGGGEDTCVSTRHLDHSREGRLDESLGTLGGKVSK